MNNFPAFAMEGPQGTAKQPKHTKALSWRHVNANKCLLNSSAGRGGASWLSNPQKSDQQPRCRVVAVTASHAKAFDAAIPLLYPHENCCDAAPDTKSQILAPKKTLSSTQGNNRSAQGSHRNCSHNRIRRGLGRGVNSLWRCCLLL